MALPLFVIYTGASMGSITGGWLSSFLLKAGWPLNASRKTALLVCALAVTPIMLAASTPNAWLAVLLIALAAGTSRLVGKHLHARFRHISPTRSRVAPRLRHHGEDDCWNAYRQGRGLHSAEHRILRAGVSCSLSYRRSRLGSSRCNLMCLRSASGDQRAAGASDLQLALSTPNRMLWLHSIPSFEELA